MTTAVEAKAIEKKVSYSRMASAQPEISPPALRESSPAKRPGGSPPALRFHQRPSRDFPGRHLTSAGSVPTWKRVQDISCILISLPLTLPCMLAVALWIKLVSRGPALFRQERIGRNGKTFTLYKFRSMRLDADTKRHENHFRHLVQSDSPMVKLDLLCDSRLIPGGCFLRAAGLDELPQLLNVLRGEMSLVGPRPCLPEEYRFFSLRQRERFEVLPGLTGIWQVVGKGVSTFSEMNAMDALYARRASAVMDLAIMFRTPIALLRQMRQAMKHNKETAADSEYGSTRDAALTVCSSQRMG